jgi:hypothetical protein
VFAEHGVSELLGLDGNHLDPDRLVIPLEMFRPTDLSSPFEVGRTFDLAVCLEVAEHLPAQAAADFVASVAKAAPIVLFSAAVPGQGGEHHVNEQWPAYWAALFAAAGHKCSDALRPQLWMHDGIDFWYRQNMLLFFDPAHAIAERLAARGAIGPPLPLVHPELFLRSLSSAAAPAESSRRRRAVRKAIEIVGRMARRGS